MPHADRGNLRSRLLVFVQTQFVIFNWNEVFTTYVQLFGCAKPTRTWLGQHEHFQLGAVLKLRTVCRSKVPSITSKTKVDKQVKSVQSVETRLGAPFDDPVPSEHAHKQGNQELQLPRPGQPAHNGHVVQVLVGSFEQQNPLRLSLVQPFELLLGQDAVLQHLLFLL